MEPEKNGGEARQRCKGRSPWQDRAVGPPRGDLNFMSQCPTCCGVPREAIKNRGNPVTFLSYPQLPMTESETRMKETARNAADDDEEEEEMPEMEVYSYEREEIYDSSGEYDEEPIQAIYEDDGNKNTNASQLRGSCHTIEVHGDSEDEFENQRQFEEETPEDNANNDGSQEDDEEDEDEDDEEDSDREEEENNPDEAEDDNGDSLSQSITRSGDGIGGPKTLPSLAFDPMNPATITLLEYADYPERIPNTPFTEVEDIDEEYRNAKHMAKNYHKFLRDIYKELNVSLKPLPNYETAWGAISGTLNTKRVDVFSEFRLGFIFQRFGRNCLIEGSPFEEGLFEFGEAFAITASTKEALLHDVTTAFLKPLEYFLGKEWPELMMHDQHVENMAKKLRKARADPNKLKEKNFIGKNKNKTTNRNFNANAGKKGADTTSQGADDLEASIQEKLHKSEVARLRKAFSDKRNNTLSLFQFFLTSEYSQLTKLMELAECYLEYHREVYDLFSQLIKSLQAKITTIRPPRDERQTIVDLHLQQAPTGDSTDPQVTTKSTGVGPGAAAPTSRDTQTSMPRKKEKSQHAAPPSRLTPRQPKMTRDANTGTARPRKPAKPIHQCDCPTNQLLFLPAIPDVSSFGAPPSGRHLPDQRQQQRVSSSAGGSSYDPESSEHSLDVEPSERGRGEGDKNLLNLRQGGPNEEKMQNDDYRRGPEETARRDDEDKNSPGNAAGLVPCTGHCPGACGNDGSFYVPRDRFEDKQRDKPEFPTFQRKIPPIGRIYDEFDDDDDDTKPKECRPCQKGPNHGFVGPCTCAREIEWRSKNKPANESYFNYLSAVEHVEPFGFIKKEIPVDTFPAGLRVDVGDMVDLLSKEGGVYEVRLCDGTKRKGRVNADAIHVIEDARPPNVCGHGSLGMGGRDHAGEERRDAGGGRDDAGEERHDAGEGRDDARNSRDEARKCAEDARNSTEGARNSTEEARNSTEDARNSEEDARNSVENDTKENTNNSGGNTNNSSEQLQREREQLQRERDELRREREEFQRERKRKQK